MTNQEAIKMLTAKVECMRQETSGTDIDCNRRNCDDCELCYAQGTIGEQIEALNVAISALQQVAIDMDGLDEEIRCEMCKNPMHTDKGCDGNCKYDEILYEKIMQILNERIKPLPSAQPEIIRCKDCKYRGGLSGFYCDIVEKVVGVDSFCSWAERRTDD